MSKKFLIIDDSALMRRVISDIIKENFKYDALDIARDGVDGFDKIVTRPNYYDIIFLDINMPKMDGLEVLEMLQKNKLHEPVVVVSTVAKEGAVETIKALELGALDFLTKPENFLDVKSDDFRSRLVDITNVVTGSEMNKQAISGVKTITDANASVMSSLLTRSRRDKVRTAPVKKRPKSSVPFGTRPGIKKLVALACSTGGPKSLQQVIPELPANLDAPMLIVQHMPKGFTKSLAVRLNELSAVAVSEACDGDILEKGHVYIAPGGSHMEITQRADGTNVIAITSDPPIDGLRPCANVMYRSLTKTDYDEITCVVLTGMGSDGTKGIRELYDSGRNIHVVSQDAETCVVYGMPKSVFEADLTDEVQPLEQIANSITKNVGVC